MNITLGHAELLPDWSSSRVKPPWRTSRLATAALALTETPTVPSIGAVATRAAQREMMAVNFILGVFKSSFSFKRMLLV